MSNYTDHYHEQADRWRGGMGSGKKAKMRRLCVFYIYADAYLGRPVEWIVCKECQQKIARGGHPFKIAVRP